MWIHLQVTHVVRGKVSDPDSLNVLSAPGSMCLSLGASSRSDGLLRSPRAEVTVLA